MACCRCLVVLCLAAVLAQCHGLGQDATLTERAYGARVVNAVVERIRSRCIFSEDRLFLRRLAYVMSRDGANSATYRPGFDGGIWQVTEKMFQDTQDCNNAYIQSACSSISSSLGIHWPAVTWSDLRKPLYSGVAAALYTLLTLGSQSMSGNVTAQANLWVQMYGGQSTTFSDTADQASAVECKDKLDIVFILDSSGSVSYTDFNLMLKFAGDVADVMNVSPDATRVADIVYSSSVMVHFDFDDYTTKDQVRSHFLTTTKLDSGTDTASGLNQAASTLYDANSGARQDAKKVAVLVTDGRSNSFSNTESAAKALKDKGTTVFAVGVGNYNLAELMVVASEPICSHVLTLTSFDHIQSILTEIQKSACEANLKFTDTQPITGNLTDPPSETTVETPVPGEDNAIEAVVGCGILDIYVSTTDPKPGPAVFDDRYRATPSSPAVLTSTETLSEGMPVYITVVGTRLPPSAASLANCSDYSWSIGVAPKKVVTVICEENGERRPCTNDDVTRAGLCQDNNEIDYPIDNPCTPESLEKGVMRHRHPYDPTKFLQCDLKGRFYVTSCPGDVIFNTESLECGFTSAGASPPADVREDNGGSPGGNSKDPSSYQDLTPLPPTAGNPCTVQALSQNKFYHKYNPDKTKFIQCDEWGKAWVMPCAPSTQWSQEHYTCIKTGSATSVKCSATDNFLADPCDHHYYYRCVHQQATRVQCYPSILFFHPTAKVCTWTDVNTAPIPATCSSG